MNKSTILIVLVCTSFFLKAQQSPLIKWSFETKGKVMSHPIIDNESVYFGSNDSVFYAIDIHTGEKQWDFKTRSAIQSKALINKDIIYLKSGNDVFALDKFTGQQKWVSISSDKKAASPIDLWDYHSGAPAIYKSMIYFGFGNGTLKGFDLKSGEIRDEILRTSASAIKSGLLIENPILYYGDWDGKIYAHNLSTGSQLWSYKTYDEKLYETFGQINTQLSVAGDLLFFGGRNPELQVLNKNTGKKKWSYIEKNGGWISGDPLVLNDTLFIGGSDNHEMFAFNATTGEKYWSFTFLNNNFSKPLAYKNYLIFTTGDAYTVYGTSTGRGYVYLLNRFDGSIKNVAKVGGNIYSSLVVKNDILFMGSADGNLYALDLEVMVNEKSNLKAKGYNSVDILDVYPFPFSDSVKVSYKINYNTNVSIKLNDLNEDKIIELYSGKIDQGEHFIIWDGKDTSGVSVENGYYFFEINANEYYKKAIIQKQFTDQ